MTSNTKTTPLDSILYPDTLGIPSQENLNYHSVVGILDFMAQNILPDISFAVHQGAHFSRHPRQATLTPPLWIAPYIQAYEAL
jgi:hypothetical protein